MIALFTDNNSEYMNALRNAKMRAIRESNHDKCTKFVNAKVRCTGMEAVLVSFYVSDWYDSDCTVARFDNGKERDI